MHEQPIEFFVDLERQVWDALVRGDADADRDLLADDFVGVYSIGVANRSDHSGQLADGPTVASYAMSDVQLLRVSAVAVMLTYRAVYRRVLGGIPGGDETMYVSSLWIQRDGRWQNVFSQDTPAV
jgi:hypothetical protein